MMNDLSLSKFIDVKKPVKHIKKLLCAKNVPGEILQLEIQSTTLKDNG